MYMPRAESYIQSMANLALNILPVHRPDTPEDPIFPDCSADVVQERKR